MRKSSGKPDDRKGHVRFEVAGARNGFTVRLVRRRQTKETVTDRLYLRNTAPVLDPTLIAISVSPSALVHFEIYSAALSKVDFRGHVTDLVLTSRVT